MTSNVQEFLQVGERVPTPYGDNTLVPKRADAYGGIFASPFMPWRQVLSQEGSYHLFHNATNDAATTLAGHAAPVLADMTTNGCVKPLVFLRNLINSTLKQIFLDWIEITCITAGANGTTASYSAELDTGATRFSSGGTALTVHNANMQIATALDATQMTLLGGAVVAGNATSAVRQIGFGDLRPSIEVAGDRKVFDFSGDYAVPPAAAGGAVRTDVVRMPPVALGYTDQFLLGLYAPSQSVAGIYKVRGALYVR